MQEIKLSELGFRGLMKGKRVVIPGLMNKFGVFVAKRVPTIIPTKIAKSVTR